MPISGLEPTRRTCSYAHTSPTARFHLYGYLPILRDALYHALDSSPQSQPRRRSSLARQQHVHASQGLNRLTVTSYALRTLTNKRTRASCSKCSLVGLKVLRLSYNPSLQTLVLHYWHS